MVGQKKFRVSKAIIYLLLTLLAFICLYPVLYVLSMSFSNEEHLILRDVYFFPKGFTFDSYALLFETNEIWRAYLNTIIYTVLGTLVGMTATLTLAFAVSAKKISRQKNRYLGCNVHDAFFGRNGAYLYPCARFGIDGYALGNRFTGSGKCMEYDRRKNLFYDDLPCNI